MGQVLVPFARSQGPLGENYTRNEWGRFENYTRNEWGRFENYTRNEWRRLGDVVSIKDKSSSLVAKWGSTEKVNLSDQIEERIGGNLQSY
jgi:hypothetical protein